MTPIQQLMLGVGAKKKTYMDDVFSTYLFRGNATSRSITNGIDLSGEGGMTWIKNRDATSGQDIFDTVRGTGKRLTAESNAAQSNAGNCVNAFNSNGFGLGTDSMTNTNNEDYASWTFRKAPGFFDVVTYTGDDNTSQQISHSLGCVPGMFMVKCTSETQSWAVYHRTTGNTKGLYLNGVGGGDTSSGFWNNTSATSTHFTVSDADPGAFTTNKNNATYVAYLFAGGESTAATARSVEFDSTFPGDDLKIASSSDFEYGTGDFTWEAYVKPTDLSTSNRYVLNHKTASGLIGGIYIHLSNQCLAYENASGSGDTILANRKIYKGQWTHVAVSRNSNVTRLFQNGLLVGTGTHDDYSFPATDFYVGINSSGGGGGFDGNISNVRIIKGTGLYTSPFKPPTEPLTNVTNTKLLCCNNSSVTGSTVTPGTITSEGNTPTASTDSPFDDPAAFTFGENGDQGIIKCGSYTGSGSVGMEVNVGWEPQWILLKRTAATANWVLADNIRGISNADNDSWLYPNTNAAELASADILELTSDGFKVISNGTYFNNDGDTYIWMAIRRPDGYVGKPADAGTDVFSMDTGNSSSTTPAFDSNFVVDMFLHQKPASAGLDWRLTTRFNASDKLPPNTAAAESDESPNNEMDSNVGVGRNYDSDWQAWMWKRHAGFDVVAYKGNGMQNTGHYHNLSKTPEMIWTKNRDSTGGGTDEAWVVWHKNLGADGSNVNNQFMRLNTNDDEMGNNNIYGGSNATAPTATHWTTGEHETVNDSNYNYIAMLFASVSGISKVGSYTGTGVNSSPYGPSISLDFQPRFIMIKNASNTADWGIWDSSRSLGSETSQRLLLNTTAAQYGVTWIRDVNSSGFKIYNDDHEINTNNETYIYYAHA